MTRKAAPATFMVRVEVGSFVSGKFASLSLRKYHLVTSEFLRFSLQANEEFRSEPASTMSFMCVNIQSLGDPSN